MNGLICVNCGHAIDRADVLDCVTCGMSCCVFCASFVVGCQPEYPYCDVCVSAWREKVKRPARRWQM